MNKQNSASVPDENRIEELLGMIQPVPGEEFHRRMHRVPWSGNQSHAGLFSPRMRVAIALVMFAILAAFIATPQGRAWAQEVVQFFRKVNFTSIPVSPEEQEWRDTPSGQYELPLVPVFIPTPAPEMMGLKECRSPQNIQSYACQVAYAESKLGFDLKEFPQTREGWIFKSIQLDLASRSATIIYTHYTEHGGDFILKQGLGMFQNGYETWSLVPAEKIEPVQIGPYTGEYVLGNFSLRQGDNAWRWDTEGEIQRLAWSDGKRWYYIEILPPGPGHITRNEMVTLASGLVDSPVEVADPLNPNSLASIADAEAYSKLDVKAPTILPLGYKFSHTRYFPFNNEVHLHYESYGEKLVVYEWKGNPDDFDALSKIYVDHEIVQVHGTPAFYGAPKAVSQYESSYLFLAWKEDALNYRLYFYFDPAWGSGMLNHSKMIAIAESMGDINDYKRNDQKLYEYVDIYERSLGFRIKEFPEVPTGWSYENVAAHVHPDCISISYSAIKENGRLTLRQCSADTRNDKIPSSVIQDIMIGKTKGQYIVGNFDTGEDGKTIWRSDLLYKQLRWQDGGLWLELAVYGESAILYDQNDLISLAESLK